jgi:hypothetical protein
VFLVTFVVNYQKSRSAWRRPRNTMVGSFLKIAKQFSKNSPKHHIRVYPGHPIDLIILASGFFKKPLTPA